MSAPSLDEAFLKAEVWPRFSRVRSRTEVYLANHSLGRPPDRAAEDVRAALDAWYLHMDGAWEAWLEMRDRHRRLTAQLIGAPSPDCVVPKTSAGQGLRAVLNSFPHKPAVLTTDAEFDSLDFILRVYRQQGRIDLAIAPFERFVFQKCDLLVLSSVAFRTGRIFPGVRDLVRQAHAAQALVLLDVYHHAGAIPLDVAALDADFAVGGSYKYLRGGPGACWLYVHPRHHTRITLDTGWFAKKDVFAYQRPEPPRFASGGDAWLESTPPVLPPAQALAGLEFTLEMGVEHIRAHNLRQKAFLSSLLPVEGAGADHGAFVTITRPDAASLCERLQCRGVKADARGEHLRLCPDLLNAEAELRLAARVLQEELLHAA